MGSGNIADDFLGRKIELLRLAQELFKVLHDGRVIESVDDTLVRIHDEVDVAARHGLALQVELDLAVLAAKCDEDGKVASGPNNGGPQPAIHMPARYEYVAAFLPGC